VNPFRLIYFVILGLAAAPFVLLALALTGIRHWQQERETAAVLKAFEAAVAGDFALITLRDRDGVVVADFLPPDAKGQAARWMERNGWPILPDRPVILMKPDWYGDDLIAHTSPTYSIPCDDDDIDCADRVSCQFLVGESLYSWNGGCVQKPYPVHVPHFCELMKGRASGR
jgi:hypothetical protein